MRMSRRLPLMAAFAAILWTMVTTLTLVGIDYGTEWYKVAILKSGKPLKMVLNFESKRKTASNVVVSTPQNLRRFGSEANIYATSRPMEAFPDLKMILGRQFDDPVCGRYRETYPNDMQRHAELGTAIFGSQNFTAEELVGMQLTQAVSMSATPDSAAGIDVLVLAIPPSFNPRQRQAILDAASFTGIKVDRFVNDIAAVAIHWSLNKDPENQETYIFLDVGAGSTCAALVDFSRDDAGNKRVTVVDYAFDDTLGGREFDRRLHGHLIQSFESQSGKDVAHNDSVKAKLLKETERVKQVLSANGEVVTVMEDVIPDVHFRTTTTRDHFEKLCEDLLPRVTDPVNRILTKSGLNRADIKQIIVFGGGVRIPMVMGALKKAFGDDGIATTVNQDEAAVMGATLFAATQRRTFRGKKVVFQDISLYPFSVEYEDPKDGVRKMVEIFPPNSKMGHRKSITFQQAKDFEFDLIWADPSSSEKHRISTVKVLGVTDLSAADGDEKDVKVSIEINDFSLPVVRKVEVKAGEHGLKAKLMGWFENQVKEEDEEAAASDIDRHNSTAKDQDERQSTDGPKDQVTGVSVTYEVLPAPQSGLSLQHKERARERTRVLEDAEHARQALAAARNNLESLIYRVRDKLRYYGLPDDEGGDEVLGKVLTEDQKKPLELVLNEMYEWLDFSAHGAELSDLSERERRLTEEWQPVLSRMSEYRQRPAAFEALDDSLRTFRTKLEGTKSEMETYLNQESVQALFMDYKPGGDVKSAQEFLDDARTMQGARKPWEEPYVKVVDIKEWTKRVETAASAYVARLSMAERIYTAAQKKKKDEEDELKKAADAAKEDTEPVGHSAEGGGEEDRSRGEQMAGEEGGGDVGGDVSSEQAPDQAVEDSAAAKKTAEDAYIKTDL